MLSTLFTTLGVLIGTTFIGWLFSYAIVDGRTTADGTTHLEFTPALHVYGALMGLSAMASVVGFGSIAFMSTSAGVSIAIISIPFFVMSVWGLFAGYGGRLSYDSEGVIYHGLRTKRYAKWGEVSAIRDGDFAQYLVIGERKLVISKALSGFHAFANEAHRHGVIVDGTLR